MNYILLILLFCSSIAIVIYSIALENKTHTLEKVILEKHEIETAKKEELKKYFKEEINEFEIRRAELKGELSKIQCILAEKETRYQEVNQDLELYREGKLKEIDSAGAEYEKRQRLIVENAVDEYRDLKKRDFEKFLEDLRKRIDLANEEYEMLKKYLEEERSKRAAVNEQIRRARALEEQEDFYRIQLDPNDKDDVEILRTIAPRLRHPEAINKVIWTGYYQKPLAELRKRLLPNGDVSCVYMATRMKTGEVYVGQTTSFDKRLQEHTRSALGIGTLASSTLHRKMAEDGPEQFLWSILEEVPKDKLRERESYYIDFYDSKNYGLNTVSGDKNK